VTLLLNRELVSRAK